MAWKGLQNYFKISKKQQKKHCSVLFRIFARLQLGTMLVKNSSTCISSESTRFQNIFSGHWSIWIFYCLGICHWLHSCLCMENTDAMQVVLCAICHGSGSEPNLMILAFQDMDIFEAPKPEENDHVSAAKFVKVLRFLFTVLKSNIKPFEHKHFIKYLSFGLHK